MLTLNIYADTVSAKAVHAVVAYCNQQDIHLQQLVASHCGISVECSN